MAAATETASEKSSATAADSYIGSLISLTSKSEIRYEGVLYNINPDESSIGLRNVRSFGTEGRKQDGPQVPPSEKVYEYILFRGSDIKDLQVKAAPPVQPAAPINNDPAIIQSHYSRPLPASNSTPSGVSSPSPDLSSNTQIGLHGSGFQRNIPLYQPGGTLGSWGPSPPPPSGNGSGLAMPMYWQGYYAPPNGLPHLHQQSLLQTPPGLSMPTSLPQPMQYPSFLAPLSTGASSFPGSKLPEAPSPFLSTCTSSPTLTSSSPSPSTLASTTLSSMLLSQPSATLASELLPSLLPNKAPIPVPSTLAASAGLPLLSSLTSSPEPNAVLPSIPNKPSTIPGSILPESISHSTASVVGITNSANPEKQTPSLVTPGQLLQSGPAVVPSSQPSQTVHKDVEVVRVSSSVASEESAPVSGEAQPPLLPLPAPELRSQKPNGTPYQSHQGYRGRERGRGSRRSRPVMKFTEDFDFTAMNEKFNKDEVWGNLGKSNKTQSKDKEDGKHSDEDGYEDEDDAELPKIEVKPVYNKDDFFDSLSSNTLDRESQNGRPKFSEQRRLDTETFGEFSRYRGGRGGRVPPHGGRFRGSYHGRGYGYGGRGHGFGGRGRWQGTSSRP